MPAERCYVGAVVNGSDQFYQRDSERKSKDGRWESVPYFVLNRSEATTMSEGAAKIFVARLRSMRVNSAWIEDARDGRRIDLAYESQQSSGEDTRVPMKASLDDQNYFAVRPANTVEGPRWFVRCTVPGRPEPDTVYSETILGALQRAQDLNFLQYGESAPAPEPKPQPVNNSRVVRRRPGDQFNA
jgi:hypothetical protein